MPGAAAAPLPTTLSVTTSEAGLATATVGALLPLPPQADRLRTAEKAATRKGDFMDMGILASAWC